MKVLDRYLVRELLFPVFFCSLMLIFLILIADLFDSLDSIFKHHTALPIVIRYYLCLIPYIFVQTIPWATWTGTLFLLVNFGFHNELLAMKVAGLKITSIIRPILFVGFLIGIFVFVLNDRLVPWTYRKANEFREVYIEKKKDANQGKALQNITYDAEGKHLYFFRVLFPAKGYGEDVIILWRDKKMGKTRQKISAKAGHWKGGVWEFEQVSEHQIDSRGRVLGEPAFYPKKSYMELTVSPKELVSASQESIYLSYREMKHSMQKIKETGVDASPEMVDLQDRLASPWQSLVMMLIAIPLLGRTKTRKGIATSVLVCVGLILVYFTTGAVGLALGKSGKLFPFASAWLANIIFAIGTVANLEKANY